MSHMAYGRMVLRIVATLAAIGLTAACGFKGPLYLPPPQSPDPAPQPPQSTTQTQGPGDSQAQPSVSNQSSATPPQ